MKNPYTKGPRDEKWLNSDHVPWSQVSKWLWFEDTGALWMSSRRIQEFHRHSRDYILPILKRYVRRYGYASEKFFSAAYDRIENKHGFSEYSHTHRYFPGREELARFGWEPDGAYCAVNFDVACESCGDTSAYNYIAAAFNGSETNRPASREAVAAWSDAYSLPLHSTGKYWFGVVQTRCRSEFCEFLREAFGFMNGAHPLIDKAKDIGVPTRKPSRYNLGTGEERLIIATASFLDFEARYRQRLSSLEAGSAGVIHHVPY